MKSSINCILCVVLLLIGDTLFAQDPDKTTSEKVIISQNVSQRLLDDLNSKIPETKNSKVSWELTAYGYKSTYSFKNLDYMTWYDKEGNYIETLLKTPWDDRVPPILKMELDNSDYNKCTVITYWERINANNEDYYLELIDRDGKTQNVWTDENGKFSKVPVFMR